VRIFAQLFVVALVWNQTSSLAQLHNSLHNFPATSRDGYSPSGLILDTNTLYGTTASGGTNANGTIFKINTDGTAYGILRSLTNSPSPQGGMVIIGSTLYGTMFTGGAANNGSIFKINTDGSEFAELHSFSATVPSTFGTNSDGNRPPGDLVTDGNTLYGTARYGGTNGNGTIFKINKGGQGFTVIKTFLPTFLGTNNVSGNILVTSGTNTDGAYPNGGLVLDGSTLYGTTYKGGNSNGVVFAMQTDGSDYRVLKYFPNLSGIGTNSDGATPVAGLTLSDGTLYGVTVGGGAGAAGNVFKLKTNGAGFMNLHNCMYNDGGFPRNAPLLNGSMLYGTTAAGGISNKGGIFMIQTNGANFTILQEFNSTIGSQCNSKLALSSNMLLGTAASGGSKGGGVVFALAVLPQVLCNGNFGMQSNAFGFDFIGISNQTAIIEFCTNVAQPVWSPLQTNSLTGSPQYFFDDTFGRNAGCFYRIHSP
jgi:uncharacterized repeat protein (TIGR03803 family)